MSDASVDLSDRAAPVKPGSETTSTEGARTMLERHRATWSADETADNGLVDEPPGTPWTRAQAEAWRAAQPSTGSPLRLVAMQALAGGLCAAVWAGWTGRFSAFEAACIGMAIVVLPALLMALGLRRLEGSPAPWRLMGFFVLEGVKVAAMLIGLALVAWLHPGVEWVALVATLVVSLKAGWVALLRRGR
ncbi:ATP synthase subunit I [Piscinibacter sp. Jin2]|uniref:ATP synthase subunit I n=1 Tax=Aquariibacter lacus TaxID=2801332 RepID=A0A9X0XD25_9BURK|nr:ATP synthase subunit I [Piscinibacter lacus]MBL0718706.1 ATP synthase subunit I [Piscinibacter lacus]